MTTTLPTEIELQVANACLVLRGDGSVYLPEHNALLVADLHLGKDASFRAGGLPVPRGMNETTLTQLSKALKSSGAEILYLLGDLIHDRNSITPDVEKEFSSWGDRHKSVSMTLIRGNHDRHVRRFPDAWNLATRMSLVLDSFELRHEVTAESLAANDLIQIGGHLHPVTVVGRGADKMRLPCFVVGDRSIILPAFGPFKGGLKFSQSATRELYPICEGKIWRG